MLNDNHLMDKKIQIHVRLRKHQKSIWEVDKPFLSYKSNNKKFSFDCFDSIIWKENNNEVYDLCVKNVISKFIEGQSITIFAYGQTGSGKSHTMLGDVENGLIHISLGDILPGNIEMSFIEIFNEKIFDLYLKNEVKLFSKENTCVLQGMHTEKVSEYGDAITFINKCLENRKRGSTNFNSLSSRSHAVLQIKRNDNILTFIDLAGSEKSSNDANRMKEAAYINKSLLSLGKLVNNMLNNKYCGFRDSKLTRILQDSISQKSIMIAFCMISPTAECLTESLGTINFAGRLSNLEVHLAKTEECDLEKLNNEKIDFYKIQTEQKLKELEELTEKVIFKQKSNENIIEQQKKRIESLEETILTLLKKTKDKRQEEAFLLEKQMYKMKLKNENEIEEESSGCEDALLEYLET